MPRAAGIEIKVDAGQLVELLGDSMTAADLLGRWHVLREVEEEVKAKASEQLSFQEVRLGSIIPTRAVEFIANKVAFTARAVRRLQAKYRLVAFWIAGVEELQLVELAKQGLEVALRQGLTGRAFRDFMGQLFSGAGLSPLRPWHIETVFRNATRSAYMAGRFQQQVDADVSRSKKVL